MDENKVLLAILEMAKSEVVVAWKLAKEGVGLLRNAEEENEASYAKARQLIEEKTFMVAKNENIEEEVVQLRQELQDL